MRSRNRRPDRRSAGRSKLIPFVPGEEDRIRHYRRLTVNLDNREVVEAWCAEWSVALAVKNEGHHWIFTHGESIAEWWPSSAKLVFNKRWNHGIHVHGFRQAAEIILGRFFPAEA